MVDRIVAFLPVETLEPAFSTQFGPATRHLRSAIRANTGAKAPNCADSSSFNPTMVTIEGKNCHTTLANLKVGIELVL